METGIEMLAANIHLLYSLDLRQLLEELEKRMSNAQTQEQALAEKVATLEADLTTLTTVITTDLTDFTDQVAALKAQLAAPTVDISASLTALDSLDAGIKDLTAKVQSADPGAVTPPTPPTPVTPPTDGSTPPPTA